MNSAAAAPQRFGDWAAVCGVYAAGIATGDATFETDVPDRRGWAALSPVSGRWVYGGVAEVSVYVAPADAGRGIGTALLRELVRRSEAEGLWTLQAGIFPENTASLAPPSPVRLSHRRRPRAAGPDGRPLARRRPRRAAQPGGRGTARAARYPSLPASRAMRRRFASVIAVISQPTRFPGFPGSV